MYLLEQWVERISVVKLVTFNICLEVKMIFNVFIFFLTSKAFKETLLVWQSPDTQIVELYNKKYIQYHFLKS